eukprot:3005583-Amphidinium_carterae.1
MVERRLRMSSCKNQAYAVPHGVILKALSPPRKRSVSNAFLHANCAVDGDRWVRRFVARGLTCNNCDNDFIWDFTFVSTQLVSIWDTSSETRLGHSELH